MVFKVLYQELPDEIPVREQTKSLYIEGDSERDVRNKLSGRNYNIEYIQVLDDAHLAYEKKSEDFKLETV
ncbi:MAG TPA: DNA-directed RNA polymerase subunit epsilon [Lentibacillus sp.]|uniref:DNA-dependent RNA polymerase subunit epsilon n=1 Tax=Lentibacillus sp. TaxID=1925746 RepID=UPI002B4AE22F|nr:DNA-directed RNA polymerase subunit epsilon [Lentibacillus sp.]HLR62269.1 DNA-directed RNA polymerase subunit epsilon [Lentibacillus sp.]